MRKIVALTFITLDGVMQAPGGPEEDTTGGFAYGGWTVPYFDDALGQIMDEQMTRPFDLLLGRKTYDIFAGYWPDHEAEGAELNSATKYVVTHEKPELPWGPAELVTGDVVAEIQALKRREGPTLQVHGSSEMLQTLFEADLVDELWLKIFSITLGSGKYLFGEGTMPRAFTLKASQVTPAGVLVATYARKGEVQTGSFSRTSGSRPSVLSVTGGPSARSAGRFAWPI